MTKADPLVSLSLRKPTDLRMELFVLNSQVCFTSSSTMPLAWVVKAEALSYSYRPLPARREVLRCRIFFRGAPWICPLDLPLPLLIYPLRNSASMNNKIACLAKEAFRCREGSHPPGQPVKARVNLRPPSYQHLLLIGKFLATQH